MALPRLSRRPLLATVAVSLLLHGAALAAFFSFDEGATLQVGGPILVEVVALSSAGAGSPGAAPQAPQQAASASGEPVAAPQPPRHNSLPVKPPQPAAQALPAPAPAPRPAAPQLTPALPKPPQPVALEPAPQQAQRADVPPEAAPAEGVAAVEAVEEAPPPPPLKPALPSSWQATQSASLPSASDLPAEAAAEGGTQAPGADGEQGEGVGGSGGSSEAAPLSGNAPPEYPFLARKKGQQGLVLVLARISAEGRVESVSLLESSGHSSLDEAALAAVGGWRFSPALEAGVPVASSLEQPIRFRLEE